MDTVFDRDWPLFLHDQRLELENALERFLLDEGRYDCFPSLNYILAELAGNAQKANLKRAYFELSGLDPLQSADYEAGMARFRDALIAPDTVFDSAVRRGAKVRVWLGRDGQDLVFGVFNNTAPLPVEEGRFRDKLALAARFRTMQEALEAELDQSEGGGLGLIMTVLMLRKLGLDQTYLVLKSHESGTTAEVRVPPRAGVEEEIVAEAAVRAMDHIPQFPEHVLEILRLLDDPTKSFVQVVPIIRQDSNLIAELLKTANASIYALSRTIRTIEEAVSILGIPALQDLLIAVIAERLLIDEFSQPAVRRLTLEAIEVAWYCRELVRVAKLGRVSSSAFLGAMLRNFGELIVNSLFPDLTDKVAAFCRQRGWNPFHAESLTDGLNHSLAGAELARKWKFPEAVIEVIRYHHLPLEASRAHRDAVCLVYLGDFLRRKANKEAGWQDLDQAVLDHLRQKTPAEWREILEGLSAKKQP